MTELTATLIINVLDSRCGHCGKPTLIRGVTHHTDISGYNPKPGGGCGARFVDTRSEYAAVTPDHPRPPPPRPPRPARTRPSRLKALPVSTQHPPPRDSRGHFVPLSSVPLHLDPDTWDDTCTHTIERNPVTDIDDYSDNHRPEDQDPEFDYIDAPDEAPHPAPCRYPDSPACPCPDAP